ncbi:MAG: YbaK/EbsC family protein [Tissierellia bacterium]|nr:YbaK/EbsC family protein [Tissierellia bacterium]
MGVERVREYFKGFGLEDRIQVLNMSSATVELAAEAIGCEPKQIAKTITFLVDALPVMIVAAGHVKIDNAKFKARFNQKAKMIPGDQVQDYVGHRVGGVCPFAIKPGVKIYFDESLRENEILYPAAGDANSVVRLSLEEFEQVTTVVGWVNVCKRVE